MTREYEPGRDFKRLVFELGLWKDELDIVKQVTRFLSEKVGIKVSKQYAVEVLVQGRSNYLRVTQDYVEVKTAPRDF